MKSTFTERAPVFPSALPTPEVTEECSWYGSAELAEVDFVFVDVFSVPPCLRGGRMPQEENLAALRGSRSGDRDPSAPRSLEGRGEFDVRDREPEAR